MKYYVNIAEALYEKIGSCFHKDSISLFVRCGISADFSIEHFKEYLISRYGSDHILNINNLENRDQTKILLKIFDDIISEYESLQANNTQKDFEFINYKERSLNQENALKQTRLKLKNICNFDVMIENDSDAIMTYLSFLEGRS